MPQAATVVEFHRLPIPLDRDLFVRNLLREMAQGLAEKLGPDGALEFVSEIGAATGEQLNTYYRAALKTTSLSREEVARTLIDLKQRIQGDFYIVEQTDEKIVLGNRACPFGAKVLDRPALCMMTSSVFGSIASKNLGYAKVELKETIARRDPQCRVVVYLKRTAEAEGATGREFAAATDAP
jgi:predicted ArsR family transcriptional regulator